MNCSILDLSSSSSRAPTLHMTENKNSLWRCCADSVDTVLSSVQGINPDNRSIACTERERDSEAGHHLYSTGRMVLLV